MSFSTPTSRPAIYAYLDSNPQYDGQLNVGYTTRTARQSLDDIYNTSSDLAKMKQREPNVWRKA